MAWDLAHPNQVVVHKSAGAHSTRTERQSDREIQVLPYVLLGLIAILILTLLLYVAGHS